MIDIQSVDKLVLGLKYIFSIVGFTVDVEHYDEVDNNRLSSIRIYIYDLNMYYSFSYTSEYWMMQPKIPLDEKVTMLLESIIAQLNSDIINKELSIFSMVTIHPKQKVGTTKRFFNNIIINNRFHF